MALQNCRECSEKVSTDAEVCPHCGVKLPAPSRYRREVIATIMAVLIVGAIAGAFSIGILRACDRICDTIVAPAEKSDTPEAQALKAKAEELLRTGVETGAISKFDLTRATIWVDPLAWLAMNRDQKEEAIKTFAGLMRYAAGKEFVEIRSFTDDQLLGKWGITGAKIFR